MAHRGKNAMSQNYREKFFNHSSTALQEKWLSRVTFHSILNALVSPSSLSETHVPETYKYRDRALELLPG